MRVYLAKIFYSISPVNRTGMIPTLHATHQLYLLLVPTLK